MTQYVGKVWGLSKLILERPSFSAHEIQFNQGGVCSEHSHKHRYNAFYCLVGHLKIRVWAGREEPDVITLMPGALTIVPPGVYHQFEGLTDGRAIEFYWTDGPEDDDIERRTHGFKHTLLADVPLVPVSNHVH